MLKKIFEKIISIIKKENFKFDENLPTSYLILKLFNILFCYLRGIVKGIFLKKRSKVLLIGKNTIIRCSNKISVGNNFILEDNIEVDALSKQGIECGNNVKFGKNSIIKCSGSLKDLGKGIKIGSNVYFGENCYFGAAGGIEIGNDVIAGQNIRFHSENHNYEDKNKLIRLQGINRKGIKIGNNCWIGSGVTFLDGVEIGDGVIIAADTLVNKNIPNNSVIGGIPCRVLKMR